MPSAAASTLADLAPLLEGLGRRWYLFGAQAAIHYGNPRATADVDVTLELDDLPAAELIARLGEVGIVPRIPIDDSFVAQTRVLPMLHRSTGMGVDVVLAGPGPEEVFLERAQVCDFEGVQVRIATATDIVVMKVLAGRPKDLDDVVGIVRASPPGMDLDDARGLLTALGELLADGELVPALDAAVARARQRR